MEPKSVHGLDLDPNNVTNVHKLAALTNATHDKKNQVIIKRPKIHESVFERIKRGVDGYAPFVLPDKYAVVTAAGDIVDGTATPAAPSLLEHPTQAESRKFGEPNAMAGSPGS